MQPQTNKIEERLNEYYWSDKDRYLLYLNSVKGAGYKVYRNNKGEHIIKSLLQGDFGDIFGQFFGG